MASIPRLCTTTRAALLTGRNHHAVGVGCLANFDSGYPGYRGKISKDTYFSETLREVGYRNYMVGKWHVTPLTETGPTGPSTAGHWSRFDRFTVFSTPRQTLPRTRPRQQPY